MIAFETIRQRAAEKKGGDKALLALLPKVKSTRQLKAIPNDRWLAEMTKRIFQAGFSWKVVESKWAGFEEAFLGFDPGRVSFLTDDDISELTSDTRIVRHGKKIMSVRNNAAFIIDLVREHGSAGVFFANWPGEAYVDLLDVLKKRGDRLGGNTGQYFLRMIGVDSIVFSRDVVAALIDAGIVDKIPTSKRDRAAAQGAFNQWREESGWPLSHISRTLAASV